MDESAPANEIAEEPSDVVKDALPVAAGAAAAIAAGAVAAKVLSDDKPGTENMIVKEPEQLPEVAEEPSPGDAATLDKEKRKHRSSRHSRSGHHSSTSKDAPREERTRHRRRESESSPKTSSRSAKPSRRDSGVSAGSMSSHKHRSERTPEEQAAHEKRKEEKRAKAREAEAELTKSVPSETTAPSSSAADKSIPAVPRRISTSRRYSSSKGSSAADSESRKLIDLKGISVVKPTFFASEKPHYKEEKLQAPIIDRPRFSLDHERSKPSGRDSTSHHSRSHRRGKEESEASREKRKIEEEKEARRVRKESEKAILLARAEAAEEALRQRDLEVQRLQEKEDEERRARRRERRRRREEEAAAAEKILEPSEGKSSQGSGSERHRKPRKVRIEEQGVEDVRDGEATRSKERVHRHRHRREKEREMEREKEKSKGAISSLFSSVRKVFN